MDYNRMEIEYAIIGGLIQDSAQIGQYLPELMPEDFRDVVCHDIYAGLRRMFNRGAPIDRLTVVAELGKDLANPVAEAVRRAAPDMGYYVQLLKRMAIMDEANTCGLAITTAETPEQLPELVDRHHVDEVFDLLFDGGKADVAVQLRLQVPDLFPGSGLLRGGGVGLVVAGGRGGAAIAAVPGGGGRLRGLGSFRPPGGDRGLRLGGKGMLRRQQGAAPEVGVHALEVILRHGADDLQLLEDDVVFLAAVAFHIQHLVHLEVRSTWDMARNSRAERKPVSPPERRDTPSSTGRYARGEEVPRVQTAAATWPQLWAAAPPRETP